MAYLFDIKGTTVTPNTETLIVEPFKQIWSRDTSKKKEKAIKEFTYIEFISSVKRSNPYREYPEDKKHETIKSDLFGEKSKWEPDKLVKQGIEKIIEFQTDASSTYSFYISAKNALHKLKEYFDKVDLFETNERGGLMHKVNDLTRSLNDTEKVLGNFKTLEIKVQQELQEQSRIRSGKEISWFAKPENIK